MSLIRYPGSKDKMTGQIQEYFPDHLRLQLFAASGDREYREPFFGAGSVGIRLITDVLNPGCRVWLNDKDPALVAMWLSVKDHPRELAQKIQRFEPTAEAFWQFKESDDKPTGNIVEDGFRKLALHQISFSGLGYMAGGPLGGKNSENPAYPPGCRWRPMRLSKTVWELHKRLSRFKQLKITCGDFAPLIEGANESTFIYIDPPYYEKGPQLYKHSMSEHDHARLAALLGVSNASWVLSYDDHPEIRRLYSWAEISEIKVTYTTATARQPTRPKNQEIVIVPRLVSAASA